MIDWIIVNASTIVITFILAVIVGLIIRNMIKSKRTGKGGCGCGCSNCALSGQCGANKKEKTE